MKRFFDIFLSALGLFILAIPMFCVAIAIQVSLGGAPFFRQMRPGLSGYPFEIIKFRTMKDTIGPDGTPLPDVERITRLGSFLRSTSIDELPELWNVLKGDMSLVGPRPLLMEYLPRYSSTQARRHEVRPGVTGWAQINGRNMVNWDEKFKMDIWYVDNQTFLLDLHILWLTIKKVLWRDGISAHGEATMTKFTGSSLE